MAVCHYCNGTKLFQDAMCAGNGNVRCDNCNGTGHDTLLGVERTCPNCLGSGRTTCPDCKGSGKMTCPGCNGSGVE